MYIFATWWIVQAILKLSLCLWCLGHDWAKIWPAAICRRLNRRKLLAPSLDLKAVHELVGRPPTLAWDFKPSLAKHLCFFFLLKQYPLFGGCERETRRNTEAIWGVPPKRHTPKKSMGWYLPEFRLEPWTIGAATGNTSAAEHVFANGPVRILGLQVHVQGHGCSFHFGFFPFGNLSLLDK